MLPEIGNWKIKNNIKYHKIENLKIAMIFIKNHPEYYLVREEDRTLICKEEDVKQYKCKKP